MPKLNDLQSILLATAAQRDSCSVFPLPDSATAAGVRLNKALTALIKAGYAEERETHDVSAVSRTDGDLRFGLFITPAGSAAIGVGEDPSGQQVPDAIAPAPAIAGPATTEPVTRPSKTGAVVALLQRDAGATMPELIAATGWLPHTTRAALTGLRRKGHAVDRTKRDGATCYRIAVAG